MKLEDSRNQFGLLIKKRKSMVSRLPKQMQNITSALSKSS
jgi:hypothetical protein